MSFTCILVPKQFKLMPFDTLARKFKFIYTLLRQLYIGHCPLLLKPVLSHSLYQCCQISTMNLMFKVKKNENAT